MPSIFPFCHPQSEGSLAATGDGLPVPAGETR
jgi:hypothetical protein